jgi:serine/threonine protein kinase
MSPVKRPTIDSFDFPEGMIIGDKYEITDHVGSGWEGEVYKIVEINTGIERAAKFFYPQRNRENKVASRYAKMLHKLSPCPIMIQYYTHEFVDVQDTRVTCLISEFVNGELLSEFIKHQPGQRIGIFRGLHLLHALAKGLESMHNLRSYHGDLHHENIILKRIGLGFELKLLDMYHWGGNERKINMEEDICDAIKIFYDAIGGQRLYASHPPEVKHICCGLKKSLITKKFRSATHLKNYLENIEWKSNYRE